MRTAESGGFMFGYVVMNKPEIKFKDFDLYRAFYCGLCRELRERYGIPGQITLTYDMTFVILLLSGLYEPPTYRGTTRCIMHPVRKQAVRKNEITEYAADMNVFLAYYKCLDDWKDDRKVIRLAMAKLLERDDRKAETAFRNKTARVVKLLKELSAMEKAGEKDLDKMAGVSAGSWKRFLPTKKTPGRPGSGVWVSIWASLSILWTPMRMWRRMWKKEITILFLKII